MTLQKKSIEMRNSGNDFDYTYFRDALIQRVMGTNCDLDWQPWLPTAFFINGEYKGMLNIRSRTNEDHIYTFYNGEESKTGANSKKGHGTTSTTLKNSSMKTVTHLTNSTL